MLREYTAAHHFVIASVGCLLAAGLFLYVLVLLQMRYDEHDSLRRLARLTFGLVQVCLVTWVLTNAIYNMHQSCVWPLILAFVSSASVIFVLCKKATLQARLMLTMFAYPIVIAFVVIYFIFTYDWSPIPSVLDSWIYCIVPLTGACALLVLCFAPASEDVQDMEHAKLWQECPYCKSHVRPDATRCCHCTSSLPTAVAPQDANVSALRQQVEVGTNSGSGRSTAKRTKAETQVPSPSVKTPRV